MDPLAVAFGTALVTAMATDTWQQAHAAVAAMWRRLRSTGRPEAVEAADLKALEDLRDQAVSARRAGRPDVEQALAGIWQGRVQELLLADPDLAGQVRRVLDETLVPMLAPAEQAQVQRIIIKARAGGQSRQYVAGRDQYITGP